MLDVMNVGSNNNPQKVLSRLIHKDNAEYFKNVPEIELKLFEPKVEEHIRKCQHPMCKLRKEVLRL